MKTFIYSCLIGIPVVIHSLNVDILESKNNSDSFMIQSTHKENKFEIIGSKGMYDSVTKEAYLIDAQGNRTEYTKVIEYRQAVTPPGREFTLFATMPNPRYKKNNRRLAGGQFKDIKLFGIKKEKSIDRDEFEIDKNEMIEPVEDSL